MHQQPIAVYTTCERCNCRIKVSKNREGRVTYCKDCQDLAKQEEDKYRVNWGITGTYHMIYDPSESWTPRGGWFSEVEIKAGIHNFSPGTKFNSGGVLYVITANYRLERIVQN
jgi:hypothetical protein